MQLTGGTTTATNAGGEIIIVSGIGTATKSGTIMSTSAGIDGTNGGAMSLSAGTKNAGGDASMSSGSGTATSWI